MRARTTADIGAMIRERRRARGWDQQALADHIGVSRLWVSEMENGKPRVQLDLVMRALAALDLTVDVGDRPPMTGNTSSAELIRRALTEL